MCAAIMYSPWGKYLVKRDPASNGKDGIMTLDDFLSFAKNNSGIGIYVKLQVRLSLCNANRFLIVWDI